MKIEILDPRVITILKDFEDLKLIAILEQSGDLSERQTITEYNDDLEKGNEEIEKDESISAANLKSQSNKWK